MARTVRGAQSMDQRIIRLHRARYGVIAARVERDDAIREAVGAGLHRGLIARAVGLTRGRIDQIARGE